MTDMELVALYRELYLECKSYIEKLEQLLEFELDNNNSNWPDTSEYTKRIKGLEDKINNSFLDEIVKISEKEGLYK